MDLSENPLLDSAWTAQTSELFADELRDLALLEEEEETHFADELQQFSARLAEEYATGLSRQRSPACSSDGGARRHSGRSKTPVQKLTKQLSQSLSARDMTRMIKDREAAFVRARDSRPWRVALAGHKSDVQKARATADACRSVARRQQRFFAERGADAYAMSDILSGALPEESARRPASADSVSSAPSAPVSPNGAIDSAEPGGSSVGSGGGVGVGVFGWDDFAIDGAAFAMEMNAALESAYGFCPLLAGLTVSTAPAVAPVEKSVLLERMRTHAPGDVTDVPEAPWIQKTTSLPMIVSQTPRTAGSEMESMAATGKEDSAYFPSFRETDPKRKAIATATTITMRTQTTATTATTATKARITARNALTHVKKKEVTRPTIPLIECSAPNANVLLRSTTGVETSTTVRFVNRGAEMLCFRVQPSNHAWITYSLVNSSLGVPQALRTASLQSSSDANFPSSTASSQLSVAMDRPLGCGGYVEVRITFEPLAATEPVIATVLQLGHCRNMNSRSGNGAQWSFFDLNVQCETVMPTFRLIPIDADKINTPSAPSVQQSFSLSSCKSTSTSSRRKTCATTDEAKKFDVDDRMGVDVCEFPCTLAMSSFTRYFHLKNTGSDAYVTLHSSSPYFRVDPDGPFLLPWGDHVDVSVCFAPLSENRYDAEVLRLVVCETEDGPILAEHRFALRGESVLPHVSLSRLGPLELFSPLPHSPSNTSSDAVAQLLVPGTTPSAETEVHVVLHNASPLPVPFHWRVDVAGALDLRITPDTGTLAPHCDTIFSVCLRPSAATPAAAAFNLFLEGLPHVTPDILAAASSSSAASDFIAFALETYSRKKMILAVPDHNEVDLAMDPYGAFAHRTQVQPDDCCDVFAIGFYLFTDPVPPFLALIPDRIEEGMECLVNCKNVRRMTLQNDSPRPLHFCLDPTSHDCPPDVKLVAPDARDRDGVELDFFPRDGLIAPHSSLNVTVWFTLRTVGTHVAKVDCYVPELVELLAEGQRCCTHHLFLHATGVGPSVRANTECLDFGLIKLHDRGTAFFTITNDNPIPVVFELKGPMALGQPCFVFHPSSSRLGAGESIEVTVYRMGIEAGVVQTFIEILVQGGNVFAIATRATIQSPSLHLHSDVVNFGEVPENVWVEKSFTLSNHSAFDIPYDVFPAVEPPCVMIDAPPSGIARAGNCGIVVPVRCTFRRCNGADGKEDVSAYKVTLCIKSACLSRDFHLELRCDSVVQLGVAIDVISIPRSLSGELTACSYDSPSLPITIPPPPRMDTSAFLSALLWNLATFAISKRVSASSGLPVPMEQHLTRHTAPRPLMQAYCSPLELRAELPDGEPVWHELIALRLANQTGCESVYAVSALHYAVAGSAETLNASAFVRAVNGTKQSEKLDFNKRIITKTALTHQSTSKDSSHTARSVSHSGVGKSGPAFWCRSTDGSEQRERMRRTALVSAQQQLLDGRGCATVFGEGHSEAPLRAYEAADVPVALFANLPGRYEETLRVRCGDLPDAGVPVALELFGKPVLLDSTTAGFTVVDGKETLLMPSAIAGVGRSRRTFFLLNRVPRDLQVSVRIFLTPSTFAVVAVEDDGGAGTVTLRMQPVSAEAQKREFKGKGRVAATPDTFFLPAMASREVAMEYAPDAAFLPFATGTTSEGRDTDSENDDNCGSTCSESNSLANDMVVLEKEWRGGVIITAELADTPFNDAFIIDEFYRRNAHKYQAGRVLKSKSLGETLPAWATSVLRPIAMLRVKKPLLSRPGILLNNNIIPATPWEVAAMRRSLMASRSRSRSHHTHENEPSLEGTKYGTPHILNDDPIDQLLARGKTNPKHSSATTKGSNTQTNMYGSVANSSSVRASEQSDNNDNNDKDDKDDSSSSSSSSNGGDDDVESVDGAKGPHVRGAAGGSACRPIESIFADEHERDELRAFLERRRVEVAAHSRRCFTPIELDLRARVGAARLAVEPCGPNAVLRFPPLLAWQRGVQSLRLTNPACAALDFLLEVSGPCFAITTATLVAACGPDSDEANPKGRATKGKAPCEDKHHHSAAGEEVAVAARDGGGVRYAKRYRLLPGESLDAVLEYNSGSGPEQHSPRAGATEGALRILFLAAEERHATVVHGGISQHNHHHQHHNQHHNHQHHNQHHHHHHQSTPLQVPVEELEQRVRLVVTVASPSVSCIPALLHFRPGQLIHDGRRQPSYAQKLTLQSSYPFDVLYEIVSAPVIDEGDSKTAIAAITPAQALTSERQLREVVRYWDKSASGSEVADSLADNLEALTWKPPLVVDTSRFTIAPRRGVIPAVKQGGRPGTAEISVEFTEHSNVRFEASFYVLINGEYAKGGEFTVVGESRETEV